jgi:hypothetical protein
MGFIKEFKEFALKGNVIDLAGRFNSRHNLQNLKILCGLNLVFVLNLY